MRAKISAASPPSLSVHLRALLFWWRDAVPPKPVASARSTSLRHSSGLSTLSRTSSDADLRRAASTSRYCWWSSSASSASPFSIGALAGLMLDDASSPVGSRSVHDLLASHQLCQPHPRGGGGPAGGGSGGRSRSSISRFKRLIAFATFCRSASLVTPHSFSQARSAVRLVAISSSSPLPSSRGASSLRPSFCSTSSMTVAPRRIERKSCAVAGAHTATATRTVAGGNV
eukprot:3684563-Prymnesium_polylepis.2